MPERRVKIARAYRDLGRTEEEMKEIETALRLDPSLAEARKLLEELQGKKPK